MKSGYLSARGLNQALLATCFAALLGVASATSVTVDGIFTAGEYSGGTSNGSKSVLWYNGHHSIYTEAAGNMNPLLWEINDLGGAYSLNLFFEVPDYARRMIWNNAIPSNWKPGDPVVPAWGIPEAYLEAYADNHHGEARLTYGTQTGSEFIELISAGGSLTGEIDWDDFDTNGLTDHFTYVNSLEYLLGNGLATTTESFNFDTTFSIELMWDDFASEAGALAYMNSVSKMELHLSDEARGLPPREQPPTTSSVPDAGSTALMLGLSLLAFAGVKSKLRRA